MNEVYLLWHIHVDPGLTGGEDVKLIGVYTSKENAELARQRKLAYPGFKDYPDAFGISTCQLDKDLWSEGFATETMGEN